MDLYFCEKDQNVKKDVKKLIEKCGLSFASQIHLKNAEDSDVFSEMLLLGKTKTPFLVVNNEIFEKSEFENVILSIIHGKES